jgi:4-hydroxymandelate oxidase
MENGLATRRELLRFLLASPLLAGSEALALETLLGESFESDPAQGHQLIERAVDAVNVFDFQTAAKQKLQPGHYAYLSLGVDHEVTLRANRRGFERFQLRPRRLVDTRDVDTSLELLGTKVSSPIVLAPCGSQDAFHLDAELAAARAARRGNHLQILSTATSVPISDVARARSGPLWFQLYAFGPELVQDHFIAQAEEAGCPAVVITVDIVGPGENRDRLNHLRRSVNPQCEGCHGGVGAGAVRVLSETARALGIDPRELMTDQMALDWNDVERIRKRTKMKLLLKGILTHEDARLCVERGIDGIVVSNHGGRAEDVGSSTIEVLPEIVDAVGGRIPILIDSGFRRGTDMFKALALGASAVCVGRPYLWGLSAFGQEGVEVVLDLLQRELVMAMRAMGTPDLDAITSAHVRAVD